MTPTLPEILRGNFMSLAQPQTPDMAGDFMTSRIGVIALLNLLAAQDAERGTAAIVAENAAIESMLQASTTYAVVCPDPANAITPAAIDARNAALRRALIVLHTAVESLGDNDTDRRILALYALMAAGRRLELPPLP
ncbi:hypothetical protein [Sphingomonas oligophenolica]|uniref:Uncharacterized protein n=1 Tax=Sphingomonas oligophenolica TaxID=301154 RepID=A0A502CPI6_9SPHN|nr:hypothetical protein [Sphingomonas oligophenolica]TPG14574.1 hypothetical protein EAH84_04635 [Sphingomonas oligophenolica]